MDRNAPTLRLRTVFISDIHLGFKGCSADLLLDFLHHVEMDTLFLVGDIIDVWSMQRTMFWPQAHNNVLRTILGKAKRGTKVIFVPGNHDEVFREFDGAVFGNLEIHREYIHGGVHGRRMLVLHGDEFDSVVKCSPWLAKLGRLRVGSCTICGGWMVEGPELDKLTRLRVIQRCLSQDLEGLLCYRLWVGDQSVHGLLAIDIGVVLKAAAEAVCDWL